MTTDTHDPVFANRQENTDVELDEIYPDKDLSEVKAKEKQRYKDGDWE